MNNKIFTTKDNKICHDPLFIFNDSCKEINATSFLDTTCTVCPANTVPTKIGYSAYCIDKSKLNLLDTRAIAT